MPTEREKQIEEAARKDRVEQAKAVLAEAVDVLTRAQHFTEPAHERALGELAQFVKLHHGMLETQHKATVDLMSLMGKLCDGLREEARKQNEVLAGLIVELAALRRAVGV